MYQITVVTQQTRDIEPILVYCWAIVNNAGLMLGQSPQIQTNLWPQIRIYWNIFEPVATDSNLFSQIRICGHSFKSMGTDCNLWPYMRICSYRFKSVGTDSNLWERIAICGHQLQSVPTYSNNDVPIDSNMWSQISLNLWPQFQTCSHKFESMATDTILCHRFEIFIFSRCPFKHI